MLSRSIAGITSFLIIALSPSLGIGQNASPPDHVPLQKSIGQAQGDVVPSLIVLNSEGAKLDGDKLVLTGVSPNSIVFADRPVRSAGHALTAQIIKEWEPGKDSFGEVPPNATVSVFSKDGSAVRDAVVVLKSPQLEGNTLAFAVDVLEGSLDAADGPAAVFIDIIGMPLTPRSFAGAARRAYRGAWYAGAPYYHPYAPYYHPYAPYYHPYYHPYAPYIRHYGPYYRHDAPYWR